MVRVLGVLSASLLVLAACGGGGAAPSPAPAAQAAIGGEIAAKDFQFEPRSVEVKAGTAVRWTNKDSSTHTTTSGKPGSRDGTWHGELAASTGTFTFTFTQAGTFTFFCEKHVTMTGTVVVK
jgi:plastocyanin